MKKPTIEELEKILSDPAETIIILPNGEVRTTKDKKAKSAKPEVLSIDEALKRSTY
ncbi:hypothetical protein LCGC14_0650220 [marine sediment metagenome]|uniref:Uncharacterized protein n=1 Tax=marine sediment metagenome TaxID=412755 RepID=A0A0F9U4V8_9ZZZZ